MFYCHKPNPILSAELWSQRKIWGFHGDDYEESRLLGSGATCSLYFRRDSPALKMETVCSSETSVLTKTTRRQIPEDDFLLYGLNIWKFYICVSLVKCNPFECG
jgi:hypothetical protein